MYAYLANEKIGFSNRYNNVFLFIESIIWYLFLLALSKCLVK